MRLKYSAEKTVIKFKRRFQKKRKNVDCLRLSPHMVERTKAYSIRSPNAAQPHVYLNDAITGTLLASDESAASRTMNYYIIVEFFFFYY